jgi:uncharacterized protein (TIGR03435 family)
MNQTAYAVEGLVREPTTQRQFQSMLQALLEERFGLKIHTETVYGDIYALVPDRADGKLGPKVKAWDGTCAGGRMPSDEDDPVVPMCQSGYRGTGLFLEASTMFLDAELLSLPLSRNLLGAIVQDRTGLTGRYTMELEYQFTALRPLDPAVPPDLSGPSLFTVFENSGD